jgi:hypothetical protein
MGASPNVEIARTAGTAELDLRCEREQCATVHTLRWATDGFGRLTRKECTCNTCPRGSNTRLWPSAMELQDAGATGRVPHTDDAEPAPTLRDAWQRAGAAAR